MERVFSQISVIRPKLRNRLSLTTLNSILHVRYGLRRAGKFCHSCNIPEDGLKLIGGIKESLAVTDEGGPLTSQNETVESWNWKSKKKTETIDPYGKPTISAHPARFSPEDKYSRHRIIIKKRFGLLLTQQPEPIL